MRYRLARAACRLLPGLVVALALPLAALASTCTGQADLSAQDRNALGTVAGQMLADIFDDDTTGLRATLLPAEASAWDGIRAAVDQSVDLLKNGRPRLRSVYLLDVTSSGADSSYYCTTANSALTVTINMPGLTQGRYAVLLADAEGAPMAGQIGLVLAEDGSVWKLAGLTIRPGALAGHDGLWYWSHARALAQSDGWTAYYLYEAARNLLVPVDFLTSPNLDKLRQEQQQVLSGPQKAFPVRLPDGDRTWKILAVGFDTTLHQPDLAVMYESTGVTDPAALRTEATAVLSSLLRAQPGLRANFHGLWAVASSGGTNTPIKNTPIMELPMEKIP